MEIEQKIAALTVLEKAIKAENARLKAEWADGKKVGERKPAELNNSQMFLINLEAGSQTCVVEDESKVLEWALANNPQIVDFSPRVHPDSLAVLKKHPVTADGEVLPGFAFREGNPKVVMRKPKGVTDAMNNETVIAAINAGELTLGNVLEIEQ